MQLIEAPLQAQAASKTTFPPVLNSHCAALNQPYTGNAAGHKSTTDLSGLRLGPYQQILGWRPKGIVAVTGCVLAAVLGMLSVLWYTMGVIDEDVVEKEARERMERKDRKQTEGGKKLFGLRKMKN
jgi:iron transport multicopper oxidase